MKEEKSTALNEKKEEKMKSPGNTGLAEKSPNADFHQEEKYSLFNDAFDQQFSFADRLSAQKFLTIDISTDKLYYLVVLKSKKNIRIAEWGEEELPVEELDRYRSIEVALTYLKSKVYQANMHVHVSFFTPEINIRQLELPKLKQSELKKMILYKNKADLPHFNDHDIWDFEVLEEAARDKVAKVNVLVTVVPREIVNNYLGILKNAGLKPDRLVPRTFALSAGYLGMVKQTGNDVLIDIGSDATQICFFMNKQLYYLRNFAIGAINLKNAIEHSGESAEESALQEVNESDGLPNAESDSDSIRERLLSKVQKLKKRQDPLLQVLLGEILRSLEFFHGGKREYTINNIYITGAGSKIEAVLPFLKNNINYPVYPLNPKFAAYIPSPTEFSEFFCALGLGLSDNKKMNLIPPEYRKRELFKNLNILMIFIILLSGYFAATFTLNQQKNIKKYQQLFLTTEEKYKELNPVEQNYFELTRQISETQNEKNTLLGQVRETPQLMEVLRLLSNEIPENIRLTEFDFAPFSQPLAAKKGKRGQPQDQTQTSRFQVKIGGYISGDYLMGDVILIKFINQLDALGYFNKIDLIKKKKDPQKNSFTFQIEAFL